MADGGVGQMNPSSWFDGGVPEVLWEDGERVFCRGWRVSVDGTRHPVLAVLPAAEHPTPGNLDRFTHEHGLKEHLDDAWAVRPLELLRERERTILVLNYCEGRPLERLIGPPMELARFLRLAVALSAALGQLHDRGLVHKDIKPANVLVNSDTGQLWLTGFGIASRVPRELQAPGPPELIEGTLAYMAPEQTGRMNRSIDLRSDLYSLGVTLYQMLTGSLPFTASNPMEWVHCHVARNPVPPNERVKGAPTPVSAIIMRLLAKTAEERYQTAAGLESDLRRCLADWETRSRIDEFPLGERDAPDRLLIPERLYGRAREIETLRASFDRVATSGTPELVLVSGYSGIGKSSVVNELHKALVPSGLFASGKFDQYKRDIPYGTLAQAFQSLVRPLLGKSEAELGSWRDAFRLALGPNGSLIADLVPELKLIIGEQPPVPDLPSQDSQRRFQLVFRRFIAVFARPEHPLALFLDDLQWLDAATLDFLEALLSLSDVRHLLLIGAYRNNEVNSAHPLMRKLEAIRKSGATLQEIVLTPLAREDLERLIADSLHCQPERANPLAQLVHEKTAGNPFFAIQFISALAEERLLTFDQRAVRWSWDLDRIHAKGYTDNVVDLMVGKLNRLSAQSQKALQLFACVGHSAEYGLLTTAYGGLGEDLHNDLWDAVRAGLILRSQGTYRFLHDRVREAAYSLIPEAARGPTHLRIGRLLASRTEPWQIEERIFEIVSQLNRGSHLITSPEECERVAVLNLTAGKRAKASAAFAFAIECLVAGRAMLTEEDWKHNYGLMFGIELQLAECELLTANMATAEQRLAMLAERARTTVDSAAVTCMRINLYTNLNRSDRAIQMGLEYFLRADGEWSLHATAEDVRREFDRLWELLGSQTIDALLELPLMSGPDRRATVDVLTAMATPAYLTDANLFRILIIRIVVLSLEHGNSDGSCLAYVRLGGVLGTYFGHYQQGFRFGRLGVELVDKLGLDHLRARVYFVFGAHVGHWTRHLPTCQVFLRRAFDAAQEVGDHAYAVYSLDRLITNRLGSGDQLGELEREAENCREFARKLGFGSLSDQITAQLRLIRMLGGLTSYFGSFNDAEFDEGRFERRLERNTQPANLACFYWIRKLQAGVYAGDYVSAIEAVAKVEQLLWTVPTQFELAEYHFYAALARAGCRDVSSAEDWPRHVEALSAHHRQIVVWAENCPENFANRAALVGGEIARIEGRVLDAERLYEQAIRSAHANGFVNDAALANELAARFYAARGFEKIAQTYLREARYCYLRWGADGKVLQLDRLYPRLREEKPLSDPTSTIQAPVEHLDLATVIKVSQAVSGEIVLEKLIDTLMRTALEYAGAARGLLILARGDEYLMDAQATTSSDTVTVGLRQASVTAEDLPESVLHYVARTKESVLLHDASGENPFSADEYIRRRHARSILCLPLLKQSRLIGVLYLENNLICGVFTPARLAILKLLASEAAISLEYTRLYRALQEREAKIRRLVDSNIVGIFIWGAHGRIIEANEAFLRIVGYRSEDIVSGRMSWMELTPAEWRDADNRRLTELQATGTAQPYEKEYFHRNGSRVPVLVGAASFEKGRDEGVGFVVDLTDRKRAERAVRESERRYREVQMELAHANRVATMGQMSASIAHEINQPIAATVTNAQAALRWLGAQPPAIEEVREALGRIVRNGARAGEVIGRVRALVKKAPPLRDDLDINEAICEVIALSHGEVVKNGVSLQTQLAAALPLVQGDRVQLQQVVLNLMINAVEAMSGVAEGSRELLISTAKAKSDEVLVAVRDSGSGLGPESLEHIFEAFYTTKPGGLGIGLSICRSIIDAHGGRLWASASVPQGAIFQFTLPVHLASAP
jgi:PAS domain S-box-containing protein